MVTIKGADQTRRDEATPSLLALLPATLLHRSHHQPENRFYHLSFALPPFLPFFFSSALSTTDRAETIFEIERTPKDLSPR